MASPGIGEGGETGHWRTTHPQIDPERCLASRTGEVCCHVCWLYCPEAVVERGTPPKIDLTYCKGCGICERECPHGAITMETEEEA